MIPVIVPPDTLAVAVAPVPSPTTVSAGALTKPVPPLTILYDTIYPATAVSWTFDCPVPSPETANATGINCGVKNFCDYKDETLYIYFQR
mgnify:FL=1